MKSPSVPWCKACGGNLIAGSCAFCDAEITVQPEMSPSERVFRCVERNPGLGMYDIAEILGGASEQALVNTTGMLSRLCRIGALRNEGGRNERVFYAADESKLPRRKMPLAEPKPQRRRKLSAEQKKRMRDETNARRQAWRAVGLCTMCGAERDVQGRVRCRKCIDRSRDATWLYRTSERGRVKDREWRRASYRRNAENERVRSREAYHYYKQEGVCTRCCSAVAADDSLMCEECTRVARAASRLVMSRLRARRLDAGLCCRCGKNPFVPGGSSCQTCRGKVMNWKRRAA